MANNSLGGVEVGVISEDSEPFELVRIGATMAAHGVRYVLIGGVSGLFHGMAEYRTKDVDLLIQDNAENRTRLAAAMTDLNAVVARTVDRRPITGDDFTNGNTQWATDAGPVDILISAAGPQETIVVYADVEYGQEYFELEDGSRVPVASLDDVIRMKEAADRYKDHLALPELRRLRGDRYPQLATNQDPFGDFDIEDGADY